MCPVKASSRWPMRSASRRNLQEFLSLFRWDEPAVRDGLQQYVARRHANPESVGAIDETSFAKKGDKPACV
ncbi:MAG: hypothetical protein E4H01_12035 [Lysobacterales bacterium]|nr:MAG: hypothetical protein E4H01_12035 [Xanthomonadales bacterium]